MTQQSRLGDKRQWHLREAQRKRQRGVLKAFANDPICPNCNVQRSFGLSLKKLQTSQRKNNTNSRGHLLGNLKGQKQGMRVRLPPGENQHRTRRVSQRTRKRHKVAANRKEEEACTSKHGLPEWHRRFGHGNEAALAAMHPLAVDDTYADQAELSDQMMGEKIERPTVQVKEVEKKNKKKKGKMCQQLEQQEAVVGVSTIATDLQGGIQPERRKKKPKRKKNKTQFSLPGTPVGLSKKLKKGKQVQHAVTTALPPIASEEHHFASEAHQVDHVKKKRRKLQEAEQHEAAVGTPEVATDVEGSKQPEKGQTKENTSGPQKAEAGLEAPTGQGLLSQQERVGVYQSSLVSSHVKLLTKQKNGKQVQQCAGTVTWPLAASKAHQGEAGKKKRFRKKHQEVMQLDAAANAPTITAAIAGTEGRLPEQLCRGGNFWPEEVEEGSQLPQVGATILHTKAAVATPWDKTQAGPGAIQEQHRSIVQVASPLDQAAVPHERAGSNEAYAHVKHTPPPLPQVLCNDTCEFGQPGQQETATDCFLCQVSDPPSIGASDVLNPNVIELISDDEEPEVQQKQTDQAEAPEEQSASQLATPGASGDATASTVLDMSHLDSQAHMVMPGQAYTKLASRAESIAAPPLVSVAPDKSSGQSEPSTPAEQAITAGDTDDADTGPSVLSSSGDQERQQSACQPADSIHTDSLDDAANSPTVNSLQAELVDQESQQVSLANTLVGILLAEPTVPDTKALQQQRQQQSSLAEQLEATVAPAAAEAKQANGGPAVQRQQASTVELSESAQAACDKLNTSAMAVSSADAHSRASPTTAGAFAEADAGPSGHGGQPEGVFSEVVRGGLADYRRPPRGRDVLTSHLGNSQDTHYRSLQKNKKRNKSHHPSHTAGPLKGLFTLLREFEVISDPKVQREILVHSLQLRSLSQGSEVQLLRHGVESADHLMEVLRQHAPKANADDHLLMMQGPEHDIGAREAAMVCNTAIKFACDEQTRKVWRQGGEKASTADFCDSGGAAEQAMKALMPCMQRWADALKLEWGLSAEDPLEYSCAVEALMAAWIGGKLTASADKITVPYAHQVDISRVEAFLGPKQQGGGPSLFAKPAFPLPCHGTDPKAEATIPAGFPYTPTNWCSASPTALAYCDDGCGASMAHIHAHQQPASNILGVTCGLGILSTLFTRTNFHVEDALLGAYNMMCYGAPKIWYTVPVESAAIFEEELKKLHGPGALMSLTTKQMFCNLPVSRLQELKVKRFVQMPGYAVLTYPGAVYHWTISTGYSLAEATNLCVAQPERTLTHLQEWVTMLHNSSKKAESNATFLQRIEVSKNIVDILLKGPLNMHQSPHLHSQALCVRAQLNFLD